MLENDLENFSFTSQAEIGQLTPTEDYSEFFKVLSVDVGVQHLGLSLALVKKENFIFERIVAINLVDITKFTHNVCELKNCRLYHTKTMWDYLSHVFVEHPCFEEADVILVERQPPVGFVVVEQIIFGRFREKTWLINPRSVHKFFGIGVFDYDARKIETEKIASKNLSNEQKEELKNFERQHDIGDSVCQLLYWCNKRNYEYKLARRDNEIKEQQKLRDMKNINTFAYLDSFKFVPHV